MENEEKHRFILPPSSFLLRFLVSRVLTAAAAELTEFQTLRRGLLVLRRDVVSAFALGALQHNVIAWHDLTS